MISVKGKQSLLLSTASFAIFIFWLLAAPMNGPLTTAIGVDDALRYFLLPHIAALALLGRYCPRHHFARLAPGAVILTIVLTLLLPLLPFLSRILLPLIGLSGAFVALRACCRLHDSPLPLVSSAGGLVIANLALFLLHQLPQQEFIPFAIATLPLLLLLLPSIDTPPIVNSSFKLWHYLPFILIFHVVSGLMYSVIYPAYQKLAVPGGAELPFYMVAVIGAVFLVRINREIPLIIGVVLGMGSFIALQWAHPASAMFSLFIMQAGQGFIDLFLLAFLLRFAEPLRAFGVGLATLCLGIYGGQILGDVLSSHAGPVAMFGHLFLNLAVLTLYLLHRRQATQVAATLNNTSTPDDPPDTDGWNRDEIQIPDHLRLLLSERELLVLSHSLKGTTYKEIAADLDISESTVKTYMKRICDKLGVSGKRHLLQRLSQSDPFPETTPPAP
jgi:DNA-binding CsgD family transcriptional regulator